ncbi:Cloroperoxidase [Mycena belliarum]|uniref:Cloroperoxidase n=1 Tax=Mycena belliarum TaxID=1033014 RepID=A0AAD6XW81_9AGAR|nr:Cloroperoxidase [Mycena belliae]
MRFQISTFVLATVVFSTQATASHKFMPPKPTDARSPCPGLNTLANHGYLPRSGANFTIEELMDASKEAFNLDWAPILVAAKFGLLSSEDRSSFSRMNLKALNLHNLIEHDASVSRGDFGDGTGDSVHFDEKFFSVLANKNPGVDYYNVSAAGETQRDRLAHSVATNPLVVNTRKEFLLRSRESALYLSIFGNPMTGVAPKKYVNIFFREERLPIQEGWKKNKKLITVDTLAPIEDAIREFSEWKPTQACEPLILGPSLTL